MGLEAPWLVWPWFLVTTIEATHAASPTTLGAQPHAVPEGPVTQPTHTERGFPQGGAHTALSQSAHPRTAG